MRRLVAAIQRDKDGQFIEIPRDFEFPGTKVLVEKVGDALVLKPAPEGPSNESSEGSRKQGWDRLG
jgi:virulence-associated protein VagC